MYNSEHDHVLQKLRILEIGYHNMVLWWATGKSVTHSKQQ